MNRIFSRKRLGWLGKFFRLHSCVAISVGSSSAHLLLIWSARKVTDNPTEPDASPDHQYCEMPCDWESYQSGSSRQQSGQLTTAWLKKKSNHCNITFWLSLQSPDRHARAITTLAFKACSTLLFFLLFIISFYRVVPPKKGSHHDLDHDGRTITTLTPRQLS